jgi:hypothetical protein
MSIPADWPQVLDFCGTSLIIEPSPGQLSGDAGLLPIREFDERIGLTRTSAGALDAPCCSPVANRPESSVVQHCAEEVE